MIETGLESKVRWMKQDFKGRVKEFRSYSQRSEYFPLVFSDDVSFLEDFHLRVL